MKIVRILNEKQDFCGYCLGSAVFLKRENNIGMEMKIFNCFIHKRGFGNSVYEYIALHISRDIFVSLNITRERLWDI